MINKAIKKILTKRVFSIVALSLALSTEVFGGSAAAGNFGIDHASLKYQGGYFTVNKYEIKGRTYRPKVDLSFSQEGVASWYGPGFHGKKTANGEVYDQDDLVAAHRTLPLPSVVKVTNLENGLTVVVRVVDRGPFHTQKNGQERVIDLSRKAAEKLGFDKKGTAKVKIEYMHAATKALLDHFPPKDKLKAEKAFEKAEAARRV
jgi:rare lipoprotein A